MLPLASDGEVEIKLGATSPWSQATAAVGKTKRRPDKKAIAVSHRGIG